MPPDLAALLAPPSPWSVSTHVEAGHGYKDNLLRSASGEERSAFARGTVDFLALWLPAKAFDYSLFGEIAATHYFQGRSTDRDARAYLVNELGWQPVQPLRFSLSLLGYYRDEVVDQSDTDIVRVVSAIKVAGANLGPTVRWDFCSSWWLEAQGAGERKRYDDGAEDGDVGEGALRLGWKPTARLKLRLGGARRWRDFTDRTQYTAAGRDLPGTVLKIAEREAEAKIDLKWDRDGHWRTATRVSALTYRDNGSGYFSRHKRSASHEVEWNQAPWLVRVGGTARRVEFDVQTVGFGIAPPPRVIDEFSAEVRVERQLTPQWAVVARYEWERSRSNDPLSCYEVNEGLLGVRWSWEK